MMEHLLLAVIQNATNDVTDMLQRIREFSQSKRPMTQMVRWIERFFKEEVSQLIQEIDRVATNSVQRSGFARWEFPEQVHTSGD